MPGENFPGDRIVSLVDELEGLIEEAKTPFGKNAQMKVIDADVFFNILDEIRMSYPEEWQKSRRILKEREELMASAAAQADSIIADAQQQALTIAGEQEIVRLAQQQADDIRDRAQQYERETRYAAEDYAEQVFTHLEENLKSLTGTVTRCRQQLNEGAAQQNGQGGDNALFGGEAGDERGGDPPVAEAQRGKQRGDPSADQGKQAGRHGEADRPSGAVRSPSCGDRCAHGLCVLRSKR